MSKKNFRTLLFTGVCLMIGSPSVVYSIDCDAGVYIGFEEAAKGRCPLVCKGKWNGNWSNKSPFVKKPVLSVCSCNVDECPKLPQSLASRNNQGL